jgi:hypothetical protein
MRRGALAALLATLALAGCGGGDSDSDSGSGSAEDKPRATPAVTKDPGGEKVLRDALEAFTKGKADMTASLQQDLRENDEKTLVDDLWDLRNVIYEFDQALRRIEFAPGRAEHLSLTILEIDSAAIKRIDPILDAKKPPPGLPDAVKRAVQDAETIEEQAGELVALQSRS